ncbi:hypothetical protein AX16_003448 [Volvariella volvacea WC 439]|nr:hypothetical protein AX16_003448 [Volvariella volvacea WC 439]
MNSLAFRRWASTSAYRLPPTIRQLLSPRPGGAEAATTEERITVHGWVKSVRKQKNVSFAVITDGSTAKGLQTVFVGSENKLVPHLTNGASVQLTGKLVQSPGKGQDKEFLVEDGKVLGTCDPELYPIQKKAHSNEFLRDHAHLRARTDSIAAMIRLRDLLGKRISNFFEDQGFCYANTPIITANDAEGAGETFRIAPLSSQHPSSSFSTIVPPTVSPATNTEFFSRPAYLTVSHQLHLEALATSLSRVYTLSPCFRAEPSLTGRHLAEFWMLEAEWAFVAGGRETTGPGQGQGQPSRVAEVCDFVEALLRDVVGGVVVDSLGAAAEEGGNGRGVAHHWTQEDLRLLWKVGEERKRQSLLDAFSSNKPWTKMTYTEAIKELEAYNNNAIGRFEYEPKWGRPLQSEHERWLSETLVGGPVFVTDYPASEKPFYMRMNDRGEEGRETVACFDLLVPHVGELVGGSVREERIDVLERRMGGMGKEGEGEGDDAYGWYKDLRRWGGAPHAGFGMGFERLISWVGGIENVRECVPMPRWAGRMLL